MKTFRTVVVPFVAFAASLVAGCSAAAPPSSEDQDIIGGSKATKYPEAVIINMLQGGRPVAACSGTLLSPTVVLTAGHCVYGFGSWQVVAPLAKTQVAYATHGETLDWHVEGEAVDPRKHDVGLLFLSSPIDLPSYPKLATKPVASGKKIVNLGRIHDGQLSNSSLYVSKPTAVVSAADLGFPYDYRSVDVIESGDSGGADMLSGKAPHTIVAVNSGADDATEVLARVDLVADWIAKEIASGGQGAPASDDCGDVTYRGACDGDVVVWCDGALRSTDCGAAGYACGYDPGTGVYDCI